MYLHRRPDLLERMAASGQMLVPTLSCFYGVAGIDAGLARRAAPMPHAADDTGRDPLLVDLAEHNLRRPT